jgi:hypothetical protein
MLVSLYIAYPHPASRMIKEANDKNLEIQTKGNAPESRLAWLQKRNSAATRLRKIQI